MNSSYKIYTVREGPNTVDEGHRKKLLKFDLANFLHASTIILGTLARIYTVLLPLGNRKLIKLMNLNN